MEVDSRVGAGLAATLRLASVRVVAGRREVSAMPLAVSVSAAPAQATMANAVERARKVLVFKVAPRG
jgi:hypothetical protein